MQLENQKLCFKIMVSDAAQQTRKWWEWHNALMAECGVVGVKITKPVRRNGRWMTVAVLDGDYRQDAGGLLDLERTVAVLRSAEKLMDAACKRLASAQEVSEGTSPPADIAEQARCRTHPVDHHLTPSPAK